MAGSDAGLAVALGDVLVDECYDEIRRIARRLLRNASAPLFQPTELVHEALLRMLPLEALQIQDSGHMMALAARVMRQTLIDEARRMKASKRRVPDLVTTWPEQQGAFIPLETLEAALAELARMSQEHAELVELRFTLGMTVEEAAEALGVSARTIKRRWQAARAWLQRYLELNA